MEFGLIPVSVIKANVTPEVYNRLLDMALLLAARDGNNFPGLIEQYLPDAYSDLWYSGVRTFCDGTLLPQLYPMSAGDCWQLRIDTDHPQAEKDQTKRDTYDLMVLRFRQANDKIIKQEREDR